MKVQERSPLVGGVGNYIFTPRARKSPHSLEMLCWMDLFCRLTGAKKFKVRFYLVY